MNFIELVQIGDGLVGFPRKPKDGCSKVEIREVSSGTLGRLIGCVDQNSIAVWYGGHRRANYNHRYSQDVKLCDSEDIVERLKSIGLVLLFVTEKDERMRLCIACERHAEDYSFDVWSADDVELWLDGYAAYSKRTQ